MSTRVERCSIGRDRGDIDEVPYAAIKEINLNTEVQKPSIVDVLEFKGERMECGVEATPHEETSIYLFLSARGRNADAEV